MQYVERTANRKSMFFLLSREHMQHVIHATNRWQYTEGMLMKYCICLKQ